MCIFDLDGTLDLTNSKLSVEILKLSKNGIGFVTATGRTNSYVREMCRRHNIINPRYIIADNGGTIYDNIEKSYIKRTLLPVNIREKIIEEYIRIDGDAEEIRYTDGENVYASEHEDVKRYYEGEKIIEYRDKQKLIKEILDKKNDITKVTLAGKKDIMKSIIKFINENDIKCWTDMGVTKFPNKIRQNYRLDITGGETSKGEAIEFLTNYTGVKEFTCVGNGPNDFSMFEYALNCNMEVIIVRNFEYGEITKESQSVIDRVTTYAKRLGKLDKVTITDFPINGYIGKVEDDKKSKNSIFRDKINTEIRTRVDTKRIWKKKY